MKIKPGDTVMQQIHTSLEGPSSKVMDLNLVSRKDEKANHTMVDESTIRFSGILTECKSNLESIMDPVNNALCKASGYFAWDKTKV
ncbi:hypothetical protein V6N13_142240 [Hibiscus sabdariffa]